MGTKRPLDTANEQTGRERKRQKVKDAREIQAVPSNPTTTSAAPVLKPLPASIDVVKFVEARAFEINSMQTAMATVKKSASSRAWQSLPRHLRRRAASHNARRVPVRLRERAKKEMDPVKKKRLKALLAKAGKYKRLTRTEVLQRRQRNKRWLETHIWHAKRMRMENLWGYRLALHPTEKSMRPSHRAAVHGCILHDSSYNAIIELKGELSILKRVLSRICCANGTSAAAARFTNGSRVCHTEMYEDAAYPLGFISPVQVIWEPRNTPSKQANPIVSSKKGKKSAMPRNQNKADGQLTKDDVRHVWLRLHPVSYDKASRALTNAVMSVLELERIAGNPSVAVEIADLRGHFCSFDLVGPKSSQVIHGALNLDKAQSDEHKKHFWSKLATLRSPAGCSRGMIIGLHVHDPRLSFPPKNTQIEEQNELQAFAITPSPALAMSQLWSEEIRTKLQKPKFTKKELDERRSKQLVPGTRLAPLRQDDRVPIIIVQRSLQPPISTSLEDHEYDGPAMHGWTLITPFGWGMAFLSSLIFTGSRVGGLREVKSQAFESGVPHFPDDFSGTLFGDEVQKEKGEAVKAKWDRTPPAKRPSYKALGTTSPFVPDWDSVCGNMKAPALEDGFAETQRSEKTIVKPWLFYGQNTKSVVADLISAEDPSASLLESINAVRQFRELPKLEVEPSDIFKGALVLVRIEMIDRGVPTDMSIIYDTESAIVVAEQTIVSQGAPAGDILGYVTSGRMSLSRGKGFGIGTVSLAKLLASINRQGQHAPQGLTLLVREPHGEIYRKALIEVI
ncbi:hypothetical protein FRC17_000417 [Serendipita sp. 399]|nr:hypothetical protein FRC17_000417 [Serendipita sp. 399]